MDKASETVQVRVEGVWKVFGRKTREAREMAESGATREEIQTATGSVVAVRDVSFHVDAGETFVVMGLSGSGKSTLIRCVSHLVAPTEGTVELCGTELTQADSAKLRELAPPEDGHGVPAFRPVSPPQGSGQRGLRARGAGGGSSETAKTAPGSYWTRSVWTAGATTTPSN